MALSPRLEFRQTQSLVMTPQLMQAIKLLQFSHTDLAAYVEAELEKNPLLQRDEDRGDGLNDASGEEPLPGDEGSSDSDAFRDGGDEAPWMTDDLPANPQEIASTFDTTSDNIFPDDAGGAGVESSIFNAPSVGHATASGLTSGTIGDGTYNLEAFVSEQPNLVDHLMTQAGLTLSDPADILIARTLIDSVDQAGYMRADVSELAENLSTPVENVARVLSILQTFDPPGVCARDLGECLTLQLKDLNRHDPAMEALISNLDLLAKRDFRALKSLCRVDDEDLLEMIEEIKALDPKPGEAFENVTAETVVPDVIVKPGANGTWAIELNNDTLPRVLVDQAYYVTVSKTARDDEEKTYLSDCFQSANWLVKSLDQRARTILKVAAEIVKQQDMFLAKGVQYMRPLNLKKVADEIEMHESTVSRVTSNKYIMTPRGLFELKYFFTSAIASSEGGEAHSAEAVRHRIRALIDAEDPKKILSDDAIVEALKNAGVDIARRTIAKYREAMNIPSSVQRRRDKKLRAKG